MASSVLDFDREREREDFLDFSFGLLSSAPVSEPAGVAASPVVAGTSVDVLEVPVVDKGGTAESAGAGVVEVDPAEGGETSGVAV